MAQSKSGLSQSRGLDWLGEPHLTWCIYFIIALLLPDGAISLL